MVLSLGKMAVTSLLQFEYKGKSVCLSSSSFIYYSYSFLLFFFFLNKLRFISMLFKANKAWIKWRKGIKKNVNPLKYTYHMTLKQTVDTVTDVPQPHPTLPTSTQPLPTLRNPMNKNIRHFQYSLKKHRVVTDRLHHFMASSPPSYAIPGNEKGPMTA